MPTPAHATSNTTASHEHDAPPPLFIDCDGDIWTEHDGRAWILNEESARWELPLAKPTLAAVRDKFGGEFIPWPGEKS